MINTTLNTINQPKGKQVFDNFKTGVIIFAYHNLRDCNTVKSIELKIPIFPYNVNLILVLTFNVLFSRDDTKEDVFVHQVSLSSHNKLFLEGKKLQISLFIS